MITSKVTSKAQTTIPQPVRTALRINPGDELVYVLDGERVIMSRSSSDVTEDPFATFSEWASDADKEAYGGL